MGLVEKSNRPVSNLSFMSIKLWKNVLLLGSTTTVMYITYYLNANQYTTNP